MGICNSREMGTALLTVSLLSTILTALAAEQRAASQWPDMQSIQVKTHRDLQRLCIEKQGRCVIYFVAHATEDHHIFREALLHLETMQHNFHPMWADIDLRKSLFNFQQMSAAAPQVVVSDPREKLFVTAAHKVEGGTNSAKVKDSESLVTLLRVFNQPEALATIREPKEEGIKLRKMLWKIPSSHNEL